MSGSDGFSITCKCGHMDEWDAFKKSKSGIDIIEKNTFQCPGCGVAWKIERDGKPATLDNGFIIPAKRKITEVGGTL